MNTFTIPQDRCDAAVMLHAIRRGDAPDPEELIDLLFAAAPDNRCFRRLKAYSLLERHHERDADSIIAQGLLAYPDDAGFGYLRTLSLFQQGRLHEADLEIGRLLPRRSHHAATLRLAAQIARATGEASRAMLYIEMALAARPDDPEIQSELVDTLLRTGDLDRAQTLIESIHDPDPILNARLLAAQGALLDARLALTHALAKARVESDRDRILCALLDHAERDGNSAWIRELDQASGDLPEASIRAAEALLSIGDFERALSRAHRLIQTHGDHQQALGVRLVALALLGDETEAGQALETINATGHPRQGWILDLWRRGLLGRIVRDQYHPRTAGSDPRISHLRPMAGRAMAIFEGVLEDPQAPISERVELHRYRNACAAVLNEEVWTPRRLTDEVPVSL